MKGRQGFPDGFHSGLSKEWEIELGIKWWERVVNWPFVIYKSSLGRSRSVVSKIEDDWPVQEKCINETGSISLTCINVGTIFIHNFNGHPHCPFPTTLITVSNNQQSINLSWINGKKTYRNSTALPSHG